MSSRNGQATTRLNDFMRSDRGAPPPPPPLTSSGLLSAPALKPTQRAPFNQRHNHHQQQIDLGDNNKTVAHSTTTTTTTSIGPFAASDRDVVANAAGPATHIINPSLLTTTTTNNRAGQLEGGAANKRVKFKSLLESTSPVISNGDASGPRSSATTSLSIGRSPTAGGSELIDLASFSGAQSASCDTNSKTSSRRAPTSATRVGGGGGGGGGGNSRRQTQANAGDRHSDDSDQHELQQENFFDDDDDEDDDTRAAVKNVNANSETDEDNVDDDDDEDDDEGDHEREPHNLSISPSHHKLKARNTVLNRLYRRLQNLGSKITGGGGGSNSSIAYTAYEEASTSSGTVGHLASRLSASGAGGRKYKRLGKQHRNPEQTFRGSYRYARIGIVMTIFKKLLAFLVQRSTLALLGAFLIHVTLGTIYTLSNINSYLTSYMRKHGSPNATYGGSMWISSSYAVGQGISMVLGGLIERRFSARLSCILGCALHSLSIMSTAKAIDYGQLAVLLTYGFLPGFGCGLAYMTPMSNGFGWFPHRKGLVAGVILAGFGIGTFVFNMAQTAYVNPHNLSPPKDAGGYFTQEAILANVPHLFTFLGTIYASMQFVGCCLLFKPPAANSQTLTDERPILAPGEDSEMTFRKAVRSREFLVLFVVFGITNQGVLFVNSMLKEYGQIFIADDLYLAWTGSMASIANSLGRLVWGMAIDRFSFTHCFTAITSIFGTLVFLMPFEFILSSKLLYLLCTLGIFGSFSGWMSTYPVHLSRIFGLSNSGMIYGLIFVSQSLGGILTAFAAHYLIDQYSRFVPFFCVALLEVLGLAIYHLFYVNK